ncbi:polysaccharide deacetylase family protein [Saccharibacillus sp. CPCC 101409]|uniref:polysaccharide deacetylase family protein n=1 Tax=Saccharibacillus sp. CPCC 101409 TaxID=3058041 RepID=UPI002670FEF6|nr:polysaccharide deacetylase family protein [Saccharibacillus sp. CPCC 101409]MDO3409589.1 polysaccharide deacetylase family protein [Saccharibacillus sp. CPCC 101409]
MFKKTALFWLAAALVLGACGSKAEESEAPAKDPAPASSQAETPNDQADPAPASTDKAGTAADETTPADDEEAAAVDSPDAQAADETGGDQTEGEEAGTSADTAKGDSEDSDQTAAAEEVPILYHMNGNYDIVPNDESKAPKKVVLLTFDDGPKEAKMINSMFDTLDKHNAKAIFFVNGYRVKAHPELLKLIQERGGIVGNHSYDHILLNKQDNATIKKQMEDVQTIVEETIGEKPKFFRAPNAAGNDYVHQIAKENDMLYMTWSVGSLDWVNLNDPQAVIDNIFDQLHSGSNILMHELPWTVETLDNLLTKLEAKGYSFVDPRSIDTTKQP